MKTHYETAFLSKLLPLMASKPIVKLDNKPVQQLPKKISPTDFAKLNNPFENFIALAVLTLILAIFVLSRLFWNEDLYTPEEGLGYFLGLTGGIIILMGYLYGIRKYHHKLRAAGKLKYWLKLHIFLGIIGPLLVMVHSTFHIGSINGGVALISLLLVVLSGVVGRYLYTKVHFGLYGKKALLQEVQQVMWMNESGIRSRLSLTQNITEKLQVFEKTIANPVGSYKEALSSLLTIRWKCRSLYTKLGNEASNYLQTIGKHNGLRKSDINKQVKYARNMLWFYLSTIGQVARFNAFEKLLSTWRMVHVPLLYLLFVSGIVHVIAVHMY